MYRNGHAYVIETHVNTSAPRVRGNVNGRAQPQLEAVFCNARSYGLLTEDCRFIVSITLFSPWRDLTLYVALQSCLMLPIARVHHS